MEAECAEDFMMISVIVNLYDKTSPFIVSLNELGFLGGKRMYNIASEEKFWKFINEIKSRESLQTKKDKNQILFVVNRESPVASMSHIIRKLNDYGYEITFAYTILQSFP